MKNLNGSRHLQWQTKYACDYQRPSWLDCTWCKSNYVFVCVLGFFCFLFFFTADIPPLLCCRDFFPLHPTPLTLPDSQYLHSTNVPAYSRKARSLCVYVCVGTVTVPTMRQIPPVLFTSCLPDHVGQTCRDQVGRKHFFETFLEKLICAVVNKFKIVRRRGRERVKEKERDRKRNSERVR